MSPALAGGFLTTVPPGKPQGLTLKRLCLDGPPGYAVSRETPVKGSGCLEGLCQPPSLSPQQGPSQTRQRHCGDAAGSAGGCEAEQAREEGWAAAEEVVPRAGGGGVTGGGRCRAPGGRCTRETALPPG